MKKETTPAQTDNRELFTQGEWTFECVGWTPEAPKEGFAIKSGQKQIAVFGLTPTSRVMPIEYFAANPEFYKEHLTEDELKANASLIAEAKNMYHVLNECFWIFEHLAKFPTETVHTDPDKDAERYEKIKSILNRINK